MIQLYQITSEALWKLLSSTKTFFVPFAQILEYFIILRFRTSLDMFTYDFKIQEMIQLYQIASKAIWKSLEMLKNKLRTWIARIVTCLVLYDVNWQDCFRQVWTCLKFVWYELTGNFKTSLDLSSICLMHFTMMWNRYVVR